MSLSTSSSATLSIVERDVYIYLSACLPNMTKSTVALPSFIALLVVLVETSVAFSAHDSNNNFGIVDNPSHHALKFTIQPHSLHHQGRLSNTINRSMTQTKLYRKFHDYGWDKLMPDGDVAEIDTVPEELRYNTSPAKGAPPGTNVVANIRSISQFPFLNAENKGTDDSDRNQVVLRLARSAFLETQSSTEEALITNMTIQVLNFVLFPSPHIRNTNMNDDNENMGYLSLPIFGADIVSLPGNKHLVALDFQPVLPLKSDDDEELVSSLIPQQYSQLEDRLQQIHAKYQKSNSDSIPPLLPWGGDIPQKAERFFSPYALWTRLGDDNAMDTVNTVVWEAFKEYTDLYLELMNAVQSDINDGKVEVVSSPQQEEDMMNKDNPVWDGQLEYLEYRRTNDPARPMLQRLYGNEWAESVIGDVLFPDLN